MDKKSFQERIKDDSKDQKGKKKEVRMTEDSKMEYMLMNKMKEMETEYDLKEHVVIDLGNAFTKLGFSGWDLPEEKIPSIFAESKVDQEKKADLSYEIKPHQIGYDALNTEFKDAYNIKFLKPGDHKTTIDSEFLDFLKELFDKERDKKITPAEQKVIINISPIKNTENIMKLSKLFLEDLGFKALAMINSATLSLFSTGKTSGIVVECGEKRSYTVPIYEGFPLYHALNKNRIGGKDITNIITEGIVEEDLRVRPDDLKTMRSVKEKICFVPPSNDFEHYINSDEDVISLEKQLYKLPDETIINVSKTSRLLASELLFTPDVIGCKDRGLIELITESINKTVLDSDEISKLMAGNIVLSGGTTTMGGFYKRVKNDLDNLSESGHSFKVTAEGNRNIATWTGASMVASMSSFEKIFIQKEEFYDQGEDRIALFSKIF